MTFLGHIVTIDYSTTSIPLLEDPWVIEFVEKELVRFRVLREQVARRWSQGSAVEDVIMFGDEKAEIDAAIMGITHGTEIAGLKVINLLAERLLAQPLPSHRRVALILGNVKAARAGQRFLESDLNRSFAAKDSQTHETIRARALEPLLAKTKFLLDLHQTSQPAQLPFFIFPYQRKALSIASMIDREIPIVTHWGESFSKDGMCTDEFVVQHGGTGLTIELGQNSASPFSVGAGYMAALRFIDITSSGAQDDPCESRLYTWDEVVEVPQEGDAELVPGLSNFLEVKAGTKIAQINGRDKILAKDGIILFPYYHRPGLAKRPRELCRVVRPIAKSELPDHE
jgi:succinylglutamate desuccinylase